MSAFEVIVTPNRVKNARKVGMAREPTIVAMAPFSSKSIVTFEDIPVTKTARRYLCIQNPTDKSLKVLLTKGLKPEYNATLEWTSNEIAPNSSISMEISWNPMQEFTNKESIQLTDNRNYQKDVMVILKSIDKTKTKKASTKNVAKTQSITKQLKLKSPSPPQRFIKKTSTITSAPKPTNPILKQSSHEYVIEIKESGQKPFSFAATISPLSSHNNYLRINAESVSSNGIGKENTSPITTSDTYSLFDQFKFTPIGVKTNLSMSMSNTDYLASLPTPNIKYSSLSTATLPLAQGFNIENQVNGDLLEISHNINPQTPTTAAKQTSNLYDLETPKILGLKNFTPGSDLGRVFNIEQSRESSCFEPNIYSTVRQPRSTQQFLNSDIELRRKLFDAPSNTACESYEANAMNTSISPRCTTLSANVNNSQLNKTNTLSSPNLPVLSIIPEESTPEACITYVQPKELQKTFNITANISKLPIETNLVGTPLRKKFQSLKDVSSNITYEQQMLKSNMGSMPNLRESETINCIENNRYFYQSVEKDLQHNNLDTSIGSVASTTTAISTHDVQFSENEILAQSSRFNLNQIGAYSREPSTAYFVDISSSNSDAQKQFSTRLKTNLGAVPKLTNLNNRVSVIKQMPNKRRSEFNDSIERAANKYSPPKRSRCEETDLRKPNGQSFRVKTWNGTKPKKLRIPITTVQQLNLKKQREERVILFDPELHIQAVINPDPFAATTTADPFLASTMFLDEKCVDKNETQFKKWLNALVTIPEDLDVIPNRKIDFGRLFMDVRDKDVTLAQTREDVSSNYFTKYRTDSLRRAAIKLYMTDEIRKPLEKLAVHIEKKLLFIRSDRDLHLDIVLQREVLELLLCFNPLWLRIGMEVVYGEQIFMQNNSDIMSLSAFIVTRLFKDKYLEAKYSKSHTWSKEYTEHIKKFSLRKLIMLLFFIDTAKKNKIIMHNPCLFLKASEYKETKDILLKISSALLGNVGDIQRDLKRIGIVLSHKQTYIDEFDYAFRNLAVDLRDGIRLTKVMEIILLRNDLTINLRVPAISRLQRIHNVSLALNALKEADYTLTGNITAADIADGHREKTLSLLWQIIYKFRAPKFNSAATVLQTWWRKSWLHVTIKRRIADKLRKKKLSATLVLQSFFRGFIARKYVSVYRAERINACIVLQSNFRRFIAVKKYKHTLTCIFYIQRWFLSSMETKYIRNKFLLLRHSALLIQNWYRRIIFVRKLESVIPIVRSIMDEAAKQKKSAIILQRRFRSLLIMKIQRKEFLKQKNSAILIQQHFKATLVMRCVRQQYLLRKSAAITIQTKFRATIQMSIHRKMFLKQKIAAMCIQNYFRSYFLTKNIRLEFLARKKAVISLQVRYRAQIAMRVERNRYTIIKRAAIIIQQHMKATLKMKIQLQQFQQLKHATVVIQTRFRARMTMMKYKAEYLHLKNATRIIQRRYKAQLNMRLHRSQYLILKKSVINIQRRFRAVKSMVIHRSIYNDIKKAATYIQIKYRAQIAMKKDKFVFLTLKKYCIKVQQQMRANIVAKQQRMEFLKLKNAAICIQRRLRATLLMRIQKNEYLKQHNAISTLQRRFKANLLMKKERNAYLNLLKNILIVQRRYRAKKAMQCNIKRYKSIQRSVHTIQTRYRAIIAMRSKRKQFLDLKNVTILIQQRFKATLKMRVQFQKYVLQKSSAVIIQRKFRAVQLMRKQRSEYNKLKSSAIVIQQKYRGNLMMKHDKDHYLLVKKSTIVIQRMFRSYIISKTQLIQYQQYKAAAITIQRFVKSYFLMKRQRSYYMKIRKSSVTIQRRFKSFVLMKVMRSDYLLLKENVILIQTIYRANIIMKKQRKSYLELKKAVVICQRRIRLNKIMQNQRIEYLKFKQSIIVIQQRYRAIKCMQSDRFKFITLKNAVLCCQQRFRANVLMMKERCSFLCLKEATVCLQQYYRNYLLTKKDRFDFVMLRKSCLCIQRRFRANIFAKKQRNKYLRLRKSVIYIQQTFRAIKLMKIQKNNYLMLRRNCNIIQQKFRATLEMRYYRNEYRSLRKFAIIVQRRYRAKLLMKIERNNYKNIKNSVIMIQKKLRATLLMRRVITRFNAMRTAAIIIQTHFRATIKMKMERKQFVALGASATFIQQRFRAILQTRKQRSNYLALRKASIQLQQYFRANLLQKQQRAQFLLLQKSVIIIQRRFIAKRMMKLESQKYIKIKSAVSVIQYRFRAHLLMQKQRNLYTTLKSSTIFIQRYFRSKQIMKQQRDQYLLIKKSTIIIHSWYVTHKQKQIEMYKYQQVRSAILIIQCKWRAYIQMKIQRTKYLLRRKAAIIIQRNFKNYILMKKDRAAFMSLRHYVILIQQKFRANLLSRKLSNQYKLIKCLCICIQRKFRANILMQQQRNHFLLLKKNVIYLQQKFRAQRLMRIERYHYLHSRNIIIEIQSRIRGYISRLNYQAHFTPEMLELKRQQKAVKKIQAIWRGYVIRKKQTKEMKKIRENVKIINKNVKPQNVLRNKLVVFVKALKGRFNMPEALNVLTSLVKVSRTVPQLLINDSKFIANFCYGIMSQAIRSEVDKHLIQLCSCVILNLSRYELTKENAFQPHGLATVAQMLLRWCDKECEIFNTLCSVIWVFAQCSYMNKKIRDYMTTHEAIFMLRETKKLVIRKDNMRKNRVTNKNTKILSVSQKRRLPMLEPDFDLKTNKTYVFNCSVFAFDTILSRLNIKI